MSIKINIHQQNAYAESFAARATNKASYHD